jgi:NAD(P)-dependent dehydrogenase (short-subunit alcohol dehydrogenase family)
MNLDLSLFDLTGKVAIITGSWRGLGKAMAEGLSGAGATVVISGRSAAEVEATTQEFADKGREVMSLTFDATRRSDCQRLVDATVERFGRLDVMVANHGGGASRPALDIDDETWNHAIGVNLTSAFYCCQVAARQMIKQGAGGSIIVTSSTASMVAFHNLLAYGAAKGGVDQMVRQMALEWGAYNIRVNAINPGYTTHRPRGPQLDPNSETEQQINRLTPLGRSGRPEEFAGPAIFLASDASSFVTGVCLPVDGGYVAF